MQEVTKVATPAALSNQQKKEAEYAELAKWYIAEMAKPARNPTHPFFR